MFASFRSYRNYNAEESVSSTHIQMCSSSEQASMHHEMGSGRRRSGQECGEREAHIPQIHHAICRMSIKP